MMEKENMFILYRISMLFLLLFIYLFLSLRYKKVTTITMLIISFILSGFIEYYQFFSNPNDIESLLATLINIVLIQGTVFLISYFRDFRALFTGISAAAYVLLGNVVSIISWYVFKSNLIAIIIQITIHLLILILANKYLKDKYHFELENRKFGWGQLCLIPALFYIIIYSLAIWPSNIEQTPSNSVGIIFILLNSGITYTIISKLFYQQRIDDILERNNEFLKPYFASLRREIELTKAKEEQTAILRHDIRHTNNLIISYLKTNQVQQIYQLLNQVNHNLNETKPKIYCENKIINSIITSYILKAKENNIDFNMIIDVPQNLNSINEFELAIVLSNLLENAINATIKLPSQERKVQLKLYPVKNQLLLDITNTFKDKYQFSPNTGLPLSKNGEGHGYGLRSVKAYTEKWDAIFDYTIENNSIFHLKILTVM